MRTMISMFHSACPDEYKSELWFIETPNLTTIKPQLLVIFHSDCIFLFFLKQISRFPDFQISPVSYVHSFHSASLYKTVIWPSPLMRTVLSVKWTLETKPRHYTTLLLSIYLLSNFKTLALRIFCCRGNSHFRMFLKSP